MTAANANTQNLLVPLGDFKYASGTSSKAVSAVDYGYDNNGNLISDANKNITGIIYNYLNLQQQITVSNQGVITYTYDAAGNKLVKQTNDNIRAALPQQLIWVVSYIKTMYCNLLPKKKVGLGLILQIPVMYMIII